MSSLLQRSRALLVFALCGFLTITACRSQSNSNTTENSAPETVVSATPPFQTKEPERYRATRTITIVTAGGKTVVTKTSIAKDGESRRNESDGVAYLDLPEGRFVLLPDEKVYADLATAPGVPPSDDEELEISPERLLHTETGSTSYQRAGSEVIAGRNASKYRTVVNSSSSGNVSLSETLIWIDDRLSMPIRSESKSADGTRVTMELSDIALDVGKHLFQVPDDYEKIAFSELRKRLRKTD